VLSLEAGATLDWSVVGERESVSVLNAEYRKSKKEGVRSRFECVRVSEWFVYSVELSNFVVCVVDNWVTLLSERVIDACDWKGRKIEYHSFVLLYCNFYKYCVVESLLL
jgi:hypothetical protein